MQYQEFVERVENRIEPENTGASGTAIAATLDTLSERISGGEASDLAAQLPTELKGQLTASSEEAEEFPLDEFYRRVAERENLSVPDATLHAQAVVRTLREATSGGEMDDIRSQLPGEYTSLFGG